MRRNMGTLSCGWRNAQRPPAKRPRKYHNSPELTRQSRRRPLDGRRANPACEQDSSLIGAAPSSDCRSVFRRRSHKPGPNRIIGPTDIVPTAWWAARHPLEFRHDQTPHSHHAGRSGRNWSRSDRQGLRQAALRGWCRAAGSGTSRNSCAGLLIFARNRRPVRLKLSRSALLTRPNHRPGSFRV